MFIFIFLLSKCELHYDRLRFFFIFLTSKRRKYVVTIWLLGIFGCFPNLFIKIKWYLFRVSFYSIWRFFPLSSWCVCHDHDPNVYAHWTVQKSITDNNEYFARFNIAWKSYTDINRTIRKLIEWCKHKHPTGRMRKGANMLWIYALVP